MLSNIWTNHSTEHNSPFPIPFEWWIRTISNNNVFYIHCLTSVSLLFFFLKIFSITLMSIVSCLGLSMMIYEIYCVRVCILLLNFPCFWIVLFHFYGNIQISIPKEIDLREEKGHAGPNEWILYRLWLQFNAKCVAVDSVMGKSLNRTWIWGSKEWREKRERAKLGAYQSHITMFKWFKLCWPQP